MRLWLHRIRAEQVGEVRPKPGDPRNILIRDKRQLRVRENRGPQMTSLIDLIEHVTQDQRQRCSHVDRLNAWRTFERIGGIGNDDPIAVSQQRQAVLHSRLPRLILLGQCSPQSERTEKQRDNKKLPNIA